MKPATAEFATKDINKANQATQLRQSQLLDQMAGTPLEYMDKSAADQSATIGQYQRLADLKNREWEQQLTPGKAAARANLEKYIADLSSGQLDRQTQDDLKKQGYIGAATVGLSNTSDPNQVNSASNNLMGMLYGRGAQSERDRRMMAVVNPYLMQNPQTEVALGGEGAANFENSRDMYNKNLRKERLNALLGGANALTQGSQQAAEGVYQGAYQSAAAKANAKNAANAQLLNTFTGLVGTGLGFASGLGKGGGGGSANTTYNYY